MVQWPVNAPKAKSFRLVQSVITPTRISDDKARDPSLSSCLERWDSDFSIFCDLSLRNRVFLLLRTGYDPSTLCHPFSCGHRLGRAVRLGELVVRRDHASHP
jgi:hypothetical protein